MIITSGITIIKLMIRVVRFTMEDVKETQTAIVVMNSVTPCVEGRPGRKLVSECFAF